VNTFIEKIVGDFGDKRRWRQYKARVARLPESYRIAAKGVERYIMHLGGVGDSGPLLRMVEDLADLFEQAAADRTPVRQVVGADPVEFVETFLSNYPQGRWITKERDRLSDAIDRAAGDAPGNQETSR
jgi:DNA-binding ferritin-like protein (Dps family)